MHILLVAETNFECVNVWWVLRHNCTTTNEKTLAKFSLAVAAPALETLGIARTFTCCSSVHHSDPAERDSLGCWHEVHTYTHFNLQISAENVCLLIVNHLTNLLEYRAFYACSVMSLPFQPDIQHHTHVEQILWNVLQVKWCSTCRRRRCSFPSYKYILVRVVAFKFTTQTRGARIQSNHLY